MVSSSSKRFSSSVARKVYVTDIRVPRSARSSESGAKFVVKSRRGTMWDIREIVRALRWRTVVVEGGLGSLGCEGRGGGGRRGGRVGMVWFGVLGLDPIWFGIAGEKLMVDLVSKSLALGSGVV